MLIAVDWDATLVDTETQEWLPGARDALRLLRRRGHRVVIHSARANTETGVAHIRSKLGPMFAALPVEPKLGADVYIDNQAVGFDGDWPAVLRRVRQLA